MSLFHCKPLNPDPEPAGKIQVMGFCSMLYLNLFPKVSNERSTVNRCGFSFIQEPSDSECYFIDLLNGSVNRVLSELNRLRTHKPKDHRRYSVFVCVFESVFFSVKGKH